MKFLYLAQSASIDTPILKIRLSEQSQYRSLLADLVRATLAQIDGEHSLGPNPFSSRGLWDPMSQLQI